MIRYGKKEDVLRLKRLWKESFGDEDAFIDSFFEMLYQDQNVLLEEKDGMLLGASFFLPGRIFTETGWQDIRYVYALAVYPEYRGQKIATRLLDEAGERYKTPMITEPADAGLADRFYQPYGFQKCFYLDYCETNLLVQMPEPEKNVNLEPEGWQIKPVGAAEYFGLREKYFRKPGYVEWPLEHITFALREHRRQGGDALLIIWAGREDLMLYTVDDGKLVVTETTFTGGEALRYLPYLLSYRADLNVNRQKVIIKSRTNEGSSCRQLLGMAYGMTVNGGYLNLTLD